MRRRALLLFLLLLVAACGPRGLALGDHETSASPRDGSPSVRGDGSTRRVQRLGTGPVVSPGLPPSAAGDDEPRSLVLAADSPWPRVRPTLRAAAERRNASVLLEDPHAAGGVAWWPAGPRAGDRKPDLGVVAVLSESDAGRVLRVSIRGSAWPARYGCDAPARREVAGWGEVARAAFGRLLDEARAAVGHDPARLGVAIEVADAVQWKVTWGDLYPLAEEAILSDAAGVRLLPGRQGGRRARGSTETSLEWLAAHQSPDGRWSASGFGEVCDGNRMRVPAGMGPGHAAYDVGATGLSLLAFLGAGYTNRGRHKFAKTVAAGLRFLKRCQRADGGFGDGPWAAEQHAIAALALLEVYGMTGSPLWKEAAQRGLDHLPFSARSSSVDELPVTAFSIAALASAEIVNEDARQRGREIHFRHDPGFASDLLVTAQELSDSRDPYEAAVGLFGRIVLGGEPARGMGLRGAARIACLQPPVRTAENGRIDAVQWLFGTLALFQAGGPTWKPWNAQLKRAVIETQRRDGIFCCYRGSWDPVGVGSGRFGRVGATALRALCMEVYYRYDRVFGCP